MRAHKKGPDPEIVRPTVFFEGDQEHALKKLFKDDSAPVLKSVGYARLPGLEGQHAAYVAYTLTTQGEKVLNIEVEQPNLRGIAEEAAKTAFVTELMRGED